MAEIVPIVPKIFSSNRMPPEASEFKKGYTRLTPIGILSMALSRVSVDIFPLANAFLQRPKRAGVAFAPFAKGMTA
jgi:hypothetical protein